MKTAFCSPVSCIAEKLRVGVARLLGPTLIVALGAFPAASRAESALEARGYAEATTVGTFDDFTLHNATGADSVSRAASIADSHIPGLSGTAQVGGTATFGALSGSGSASSTGRTATSYFQAQPLAIAQDFITIFGGASVNLTLHYEFEASTTVPNNQPGSAGTSVQGIVSFYPSGFVDSSQVIFDNNFYFAGNDGGPPWGVFAGDASSGAFEVITGSTTVQVDGGATYGLYGSLGLFGEAQNLNGDGHQIDLVATGSVKYWISFDSPDAYLTSQSGALYRAPGGSGPGSVPEMSSGFALLGLGLGALGLMSRSRRRALQG